MLKRVRFFGVGLIGSIGSIGSMWLAGCLCIAPPLRAETVELAAEDDWAPYSHLVPGEPEPQGLSPRLVRAAFRTQGIQVRFKALPFGRCLQEARLGRVVGCFNVTRTRDNAEQFLWHPTPLFQEELAIFSKVTPGQPKSPAMQLQDLKGRRVGLTVGYTYPSDVMLDPQIQRQEFSSDANLLRMLAAGRLDVALLNTLPAYHRMRQDASLQGNVVRVGRISLDGFWVGFSRVHPDGMRLVSTFERGLQALLINGEHARMLAEFRRQWQPVLPEEALR